MDPGRASSPPVSLRLRASALTRVLGVVSPAVLVGLGLYGIAGSLRGPGPVLLIAGLALAAGVAWSIPWSTEVDGAGVRVRMPARTVVVGWGDLVAFERHRAGRRSEGALVARTASGQKVALCDVAEPPAQWDTLRELVSRHAPGVSVGTPPPGHPFLRSGGRSDGGRGR